MAKILNRASPEILAKRDSMGTPYITVNSRGLLFSRRLIQEADISVGRYAHFMNEEDYWAFFVNDDPAGFPINKDHDSVIVLCRAIVTMFVKSTGRRYGERFYCLKSTARQGESPVFEIYTRESTLEVIDRQERIKAQRKKVLNTWRPREIKTGL